MADLPDSFMSKVRKTDGCWLWIAGTTKGYGAAYINGRQRPAHRVVYEALVGEIPLGLDLDHLCRNRQCVNPAHLEPVTRRENLLRSPITLTSKKAAQTQCVRGHDFTPENTRIAANGTRHCKACHRLSRGRTKVVV